MAVVYEQDIEFNGTKLTVNPQFNETEVTRCKVNETDVIHKYNVSGIDMTARLVVDFQYWSDSSCDWMDSGVDMTIKSFSLNGSNLSDVSSVTLVNWNLELKSASNIPASIAATRVDYSTTSYTSMTSPTATFNNLISTSPSMANDDAHRRYFWITVTATLILATTEGNVTVTFSSTQDVATRVYVTAIGPDRYTFTTSGVVGDRVQEY